MRVTVSFRLALRPGVLHPCHCADLATRCALTRAVPAGEAEVGLILEYA